MTAAQDQIARAVERNAKRKMDFLGYRPLPGCPTHPDGSLILQIEFAPRPRGALWEKMVAIAIASQPIVTRGVRAGSKMPTKQGSLL